jgi:hypothetical protein
LSECVLLDEKDFSAKTYQELIQNMRTVLECNVMIKEFFLSISKDVEEGIAAKETLDLRRTWSVDCGGGRRILFLIRLERVTWRIPDIFHYLLPEQWKVVYFAIGSAKGGTMHQILKELIAKPASPIREEAQ